MYLVSIKTEILRFDFKNFIIKAWANLKMKNKLFIFIFEYHFNL